MKNYVIKGSVVISTKGYDKNEIYVVKDIINGYAHLINGMNKPFTNPKKKNLKHLKAFNVICELDENNIIKTNQEVHKLVVSFKKAIKNL